MVLPRSTNHLLHHLVFLVAVWSPVVVRAEQDYGGNGDYANMKLVTVPGPHFPSILSTLHGGKRSFDGELSSLQERLPDTSQPVRRMLPRLLNLPSRNDETRLDLQIDARGTSNEMSPGNNQRDSNNTAQTPDWLIAEGHSQGTPNKTIHHIGAEGVYENGENHPEDVSMNSFQAEMSYKSCSELTFHSLEVITNVEQIIDWPLLLRSIETCCQGIDQAYSSSKSIYGFMCGEYHKLKNSKYHGSIELKKDWHEATVRDFTDSLVAAVAEAIVAADEGKAASIADEPSTAEAVVAADEGKAESVADEASTVIDKLSKEGTSQPVSRKAGGRLLVLFVPQINGTNSEDDSPGERGEDLARYSILKIIKAKIVKSFKQFEKWVSSQTNPKKVADRSSE